MKRRGIVVSTAVVVALGACGGIASADEFPEKPITMIIPFGPGGSHDMHARMISSTIQEYLGQPIVVKLMPGAGGALAMAEAARADPDGYTVIFTHNYLDQMRPLVTEVNYGPDDFVGVAQINGSPQFAWTTPETGWTSLADVTAHMGDNPGMTNVSYGQPWGVAFTPLMMYMQKAGGLEANWVPYEGGGPTLTAFLSGDVEFGMTMMAQAREHYEVGSMVPLGVTASERDPNYPDIPTFAEQGFDVDVSMSRVILAPAATPPERVEYLSDAFAKLMEDPSFVRLISSANSSIDFMDHEELQSVREKQKGEFQELVKFAESLENK